MVAGYSRYKASEEISFVITDGSLNILNGMWHFHLLGMSKADKHASKD